MRVRNFFLMALAASMALVSCDKSENDLSAPTDTSLKSVTIKLPNITKAVSSRAIGDAMTTAANRKAVLENFKVLFLSGETDMTASVPEYDGKAQPVYFDENSLPTPNADGEYEITYHFLDVSIDRVVVVGNLENVSYAEITGSGNKATQSILNDADGEHPLYPLYGEDGLTLKTPATDNEGHENVYEASVTLAPKMSRFEIVAAGYVQDGENEPKFESLELNKIALCHYFSQYTFKTGLGTGTQTDCPTNAHVWDWIDNAMQADAIMSNAETPAKITVALGKHVNIGTGAEIADADLNSPNLGDGFTNIITYGVAGVEEATDNPELYLSFYGVDDAGAKTPLYVKGTFTNIASGAFTAGKIYRVKFTITDGVWETPERCVELTVDVADWTVEVLTPEF